VCSISAKKGATMSDEAPKKPAIGYCIYVEMFFQGPVPIVSDEDDKYIIFETELAAQREIADHRIALLREFLDGQWDYEGAITVDEFVMPVTVQPNGSFKDKRGKTFGPYIK
jgi:hypothetical protein